MSVFSASFSLFEWICICEGLFHTPLLRCHRCGLFYVCSLLTFITHYYARCLHSYSHSMSYPLPLCCYASRCLLRIYCMIGISNLNYTLFSSYVQFNQNPVYKRLLTVLAGRLAAETANPLHRACRRLNGVGAYLANVQSAPRLNLM